MKTFHIPQDYQSKILEAHRRLEAAYDDKDTERARWEAQLERTRNLYRWGDMSKEAYLKERENIQNQLNALVPAVSQARNFGRLAAFLGSVAQAWQEATGEQRNRLARCLFQEIWIKDEHVVAAKPQSELEPFFHLNYEEFVNKVLKMRPRGDSNP